jgi:hypothetical protein
MRGPHPPSVPQPQNHPSSSATPREPPPGSMQQRGGGYPSEHKRGGGGPPQPFWRAGGVPPLSGFVRQLRFQTEAPREARVVRVRAWGGGTPSCPREGGGGLRLAVLKGGPLVLREGGLPLFMENHARVPRLRAPSGHGGAGRFHFFGGHQNRRGGVPPGAAGS